MTSVIIRSDADLDYLFGILRSRKMPYTVSIAKGASRSHEQNRLQRLWLMEAADQLGDRTAEELRGECKLMFGVPIMREDEKFREAYDRVIKPRPYTEKLAMMMEPLDFPVTRLMTSGQKTRYLDAMCKHFLEQGIVLTDPVSRAMV